MNAGYSYPLVDQERLLQLLVQPSKQEILRSSTTCSDVIIYLGEATTAHTMDRNVENSLRTDRGRGIGIWINDQSLDEEYEEPIIQNCTTKMVSGCESEEMARKMATCMLSELERLKVHYRRTKLVQDGFERVDTASRREDAEGRTSWGMGESLVPRYREEEEEFYESLGDQLTMLTRRIQGMGVGERVVIRAS